LTSAANTWLTMLICTSGRQNSNSATACTNVGIKWEAREVTGTHRGDGDGELDSKHAKHTQITESKQVPRQKIREWP
jgi:hypothetical protein